MCIEWLAKEAGGGGSFENVQTCTFSKTMKQTIQPQCSQLRFFSVYQHIQTFFFPCTFDFGVSSSSCLGCRFLFALSGTMALLYPIQGDKAPLACPLYRGAFLESISLRCEQGYHTGYNNFTTPAVLISASREISVSSGSLNNMTCILILQSSEVL